MLPMQAITSAISLPSINFGSACKIAESWRAEMARGSGFGDAVAHDEVAQFAARRFDRLTNFALRDAKTFGHDLEVVDERFHLRLHLFAIRQNDARRVGPDRALRGNPSIACRTILRLCRISSTRT